MPGMEQALDKYLLSEGVKKELTPAEVKSFVHPEFKVRSDSGIFEVERRLPLRRKHAPSNGQSRGVQRVAFFFSLEVANSFEYIFINAF